MHTLVVGAGFSGFHIAVAAGKYGTVCGTRRSSPALTALESAGLETLRLSGENPADESTPAMHEEREALLGQCARTTHLISCVAPSRDAPLHDPVLNLLRSGIALPRLQWVGYLSTIGVYGNHEGGWVDESTPCTSTQTRSIMRREAEQAWQAQAHVWQVPLAILRLSGIYGPGRNAIVDAQAGRARMLIKPGQVFNRIHVTDLAQATCLAANAKYHGIVNVTDDLPAAPQEIICLAHALLDKPAPTAVPFDEADISDMARSFYSENKRVSNALSKRALGMQYQFPTYREGLESLYRLDGS